MKFLPALVESVDGQKERFRVGNVNRDRHIQRSGSLPHFIESWIVNRDKLVRPLFTQKQTQSLQDLYSFCAGSVRIFDQFRLQARIAWIRGLVPRWFCKHDEPPRVSDLELLNRLADPLSITSCQVDHRPYIFALHYRETSLGADFKSDRPGRSIRISFGYVSVKIDEGKAATRNRITRNMKHALRFVSPERQPCRP